MASGTCLLKEWSIPIAFKPRSRKALLKRAVPQHNSTDKNEDNEGFPEAKDRATGIAELKTIGASSGMLEHVDELREGERNGAAPGDRTGEPPAVNRCWVLGAAGLQASMLKLSSHELLSASWR